MLSIVWLSQSACKKSLWSQYDPSEQVWVVSDLKSKKFLTQSLLNTKEIISGEPIKRATELWAEMLRSVDPDLRSLGSLGSWVQARKFLSLRCKSEWCSRPRAPQTLLDACKSITQLVSHPLAEETLDDLETHFRLQSSFFMELAKLSRTFYLECIDEKRIPRFFIPSFLSQNAEFQPHSGKFIFDLGFDLLDGESELIRALARDNDVTVLIPARDADQLREAGLHAYRNFDLGLSHVKTETKEGLGDEKDIQIWRCSSPEAEARKAVETISQWVQDGVRPDQICVTAPDISNYINLLVHDLKWEGLGVQSDLASPLSACRPFRALNARLRIIGGSWDSKDIEEAFMIVSPYRLSKRRQVERHMIKPVIAESQVPVEEIQIRISELRKKGERQSMSRSEFENLLLDLYESIGIGRDDSQNEFFLAALQRMRSEIGDIQLNLKIWIDAWFQVSSQVDVGYHHGAAGGIWAVDLVSAEEAPATRMIILGSIESGRRHSIVSLLGQDARQFLRQGGFDLNSSSEKRADLQIQWLAGGAWTHLVVSCAKTDSLGKAVAASPIWLHMAAQKRRDTEILETAQGTKWLQVQRRILDAPVAQAVDIFKSRLEGQTADLGLRVGNDLAGLKQIHLGEALPPSLSASNLENYWQCPFKYFATAHLGLRDEKDLDVEPTPQTRGQLLHSAAEAILHSSNPLEQWSEKALEDLIDSLGPLQRQVSSDVWPATRNRFMRQLKRFVAFELDWKKRFPRSRPTDFEAQLRGTLNWSREGNDIFFSKEDIGINRQTEFSASFGGRIDRIDMTSSNQAILLDYKDRANKLDPIKSWNGKGTFQLALYTQAVEAGLLEEGPRPVIAAQYYSLKTLERDKGFQLTDVDMVDVLPASSNDSANVDKSSREDYFREIKKSVHQCLEHIREGQMTPAPQNESLCLSCGWRRLCRAPHLS